MWPQGDEGDEKEGEKKKDHAKLVKATVEVQGKGNPLHWHQSPSKVQHQAARDPPIPTNKLVSSWHLIYETF